MAMETQVWAPGTDIKETQGQGESLSQGSKWDREQEDTGHPHLAGVHAHACAHTHAHTICLLQSKLLTIDMFKQLCNS